MASRPVRLLGDPVLRQRCDPVTHVDGTTDDLVANLIATVDGSNGLGLAAPQIGVLKRVVFINVDEPWLLVNPEITWMSPEKMVVWDACLSYLTIFFQVSKAKKIRVRYQNLDREMKEIEAEDSLSELLQHEIDHLDGILAIDRVLDNRKIITREEYEKRFGPPKI